MDIIDVHGQIFDLEARVGHLEGITDALDDLMEDAKPGISFLMGQLADEVRALRQDWDALFDASKRRNALFTKKDRAA